MLYIMRPVVLAASLLFLVNNAHAAPSLSLLLSGSRDVIDVDNFLVNAIIANTGDETLKLYEDPRSALSSFPGDTFSINSQTGGSPEFVGAYAKYSYKLATSFVTLEPGANVSVPHDLGVGYDFTSEGEYKVDPSNVFYYQDSSGDPQPIYATISSVHKAKLSGSFHSSKRPVEGLDKRATFTGCTSSQKSSINTALESTATYLTEAISYLNTQVDDTPRYTSWFGTYSSTRAATVLSHFKKIKSSDPSTYKYDCSCSRDLFAYVQSTLFGTVHLCNLFWPASTTGTDSKAGTIIHEASHFTRNGGTKDIAPYGQAGSLSLAISSPADAIRNADSHEYFAENYPVLI